MFRFVVVLLIAGPLAHAQEVESGTQRAEMEAQRAAAVERRAKANAAIARTQDMMRQQAEEIRALNLGKPLAQRVETYCEGAARGLILDVRVGSFSIPTSQRPGSAEAKGEFWYGEWFGRLIPIPARDDEWQVWNLETHAKAMDSANYSVTLELLDWSKAREQSERLSYMTDLPTSSLSSFDAAYSGLTTDLTELDCDPQNVQSVVNTFDGLLLRANEFRNAEEAIVAGDHGLVARREFKRDTEWTYYFPAQPNKDVIGAIRIRANRDLFPNVGLRIVPATKPHVYSSGEPDWMPSFFEKSRALGIREY